MDAIEWLKLRVLVDRTFVCTCFFPHHQTEVQGNKKGEKKEKEIDNCNHDTKFPMPLWFIRCLKVFQYIETESRSYLNVCYHTADFFFEDVVFLGGVGESLGLPACSVSVSEHNCMRKRQKA